MTKVTVKPRRRGYSVDVVAREYNAHLRKMVLDASTRAAEKLIEALPKRIEKKRLDPLQIAEVIADAFLGGA